MNIKELASSILELRKKNDLLSDKINKLYDMKLSESQSMAKEYSRASEELLNYFTQKECEL